MLKVYDLSMNLVAYLENAFAIGYEERMNELWKAQFSLPADDEKNAECLPLRFVEVFDHDERVDLFRIIPTETKRTNDGKTITYQLEHVLGTLRDDVFFQLHQVGGIGVTTTQCLQYVLDSQLVTRWQLGTISFAHQFEYKWENENLLGGIFAIPKPFIEDYLWTWNTATFPWTLNLLQLIDGDPDCYVRYGKNLQGITKVVDPTYLVTRLYGLGYGEGVNQLTISDVNGGLPYINSDTQGTYGIVSNIFVDKRFENADTLKAQMVRMLESSKVPKITYTVDGAELYQLTSDPIDKFRSGALVRVIDAELGIDVTSRVIVRNRPDVDASPGDVRIDITNKSLNAATSMSDMNNRIRINEVYAQGATNLDSHDFADNADTTHPAIIRFYFPAETARVNKMFLSYEVSNFRAYERSIAAAAAVTSGPSSVTTTGASSTTTTASGGGIFSTDTDVQILVPGLSIDTTDIASGHSHGLFNHAHQINVAAHTHGMNHTHGMDHTHQIPSHTHGIDYGIFLYPALPTAVTITVDGNTVPITALSGSNINIIPYLAVDAGGKVLRAAWHEIKITPNDLGRVVAGVVTMLFVRSQGGGNY